MAVEIIRRGIIPHMKQYQVLCDYCKTDFRFLQSDARQACKDPRDGTVTLSINCPVCGRKVYLSDEDVIK